MSDAVMLLIVRFTDKWTQYQTKESEIGTLRNQLAQLVRQRTALVWSVARICSGIRKHTKPHKRWTQAVALLPISMRHARRLADVGDHEAAVRTRCERDGEDPDSLALRRLAAIADDLRHRQRASEDESPNDFSTYDKGIHSCQVCFTKTNFTIE